MTETATAGAPAATSPHRTGALTMARGLAGDIGLPLLAYYGLHLVGASDWVALLAATTMAGLALLWGAVRERTLSPFATVMLTVFGMGLLLSVVSGDERFLLLKDSATTAVVGTAFLVSTVCGLPLTLGAAQRWKPHLAAELAVGYHANPRCAAATG